MKSFRQRLLDTGARRSSKLIFALDRPRALHSLSEKKKSREFEAHFDRCRTLLSEVQPHVAAVKINYPLVLSIGPERTADLLEYCDVPAIADFKVADTANTSRWIARHALDMGFDAVIAHPFVGFEGGLSGLFEEARDRSAGVILVCNMSHPGSREFITPNARELTEFALRQDADGVIGPATRPEEVRRVRGWLGENESPLLLTPGIGAQGGSPGDAVGAGADFEIVGRAIYTADRPASSAETIKQQINRTVSDDAPA